MLNEELIGVVIIGSFVVYIVNWLLFAPTVGTWKKWFAWYPVKIKGQWVIFRFVERRKEFTGSSSETDFDWIAYRLPV